MTIAKGNQRETLYQYDVNVTRARDCVAVVTQQRYKLKGLILAQNERWRRGLGMQVVRSMEGSNTDYT